MTLFGFILFWVLFIALSVVACYLLSKKLNSLTSKLLLYPLAVIGAFLVDFLFYVLLMAVSYTNMKPLPETQKEVQIYSISHESDSLFTIGRGDFDGLAIPSYQYYELVNGEYRLSEVPSDNFNIVYTDSIAPKIVIDATKEGGYPSFDWFFNMRWESDLYAKEFTGTMYLPVGALVQ